MADEPAENVFIKGVQSVLRPLVRALISQGVTAPALYRMIKRIYVEVAEQDFSLDNARQTDSRISMLTGVHRGDVRSFRKDDLPAVDAVQEKTTTLASVLGRWLAGEQTRDIDGRPIPLPRTAEAGPSFDALVRSVSTDIRPRTVLDELLRQGLVVQEDDLIHLRADAFLGPTDPDQKVYFFAENLGDHITAAVDNLLSDEPPFMERAVFYNRLTSDSIDALEDEARDVAGSVLVRLNELAHKNQERDLDAPDGTHRFRFGVYFYREDEATSDTKTGAGDNEED